METEILRKGRKIPLASLIMAFLQHWGETRRQNRTFIPEGDGETSQVTKRCFYHMQWSNLEKGTRFKLQCHHSNSAWSYTYPWSLLVRRILFCKGSWANWHLISSLSLSFFFFNSRFSSWPPNRDIGMLSRNGGLSHKWVQNLVKNS